MANPPSPTGHYASPKTIGTIVHYGLEDIAITGLIVDSYRRSAKYAKVEEVTGQVGITEGIRMSDFRADVSVSGRMKEGVTFTLKVGDQLSINGDSILIMSLDMSGSSSGFTTLDISGTAFEGVAGYEPV